MPAVFMGSASSPAIRVTKRPCKAWTCQQSGTLFWADLCEEIVVWVVQGCDALLFSQQQQQLFGGFIQLSTASSLPNLFYCHYGYM